MMSCRGELKRNSRRRQMHVKWTGDEVLWIFILIASYESLSCAYIIWASYIVLVL
jgi:hypothetical protein